MTKTFCDRCGAAFSDDYSDGVNLDWNSFGVVGFKPVQKEYNFCLECAEVIDKLIHGQTVNICLTVTRDNPELLEEAQHDD